MTRASTTSRVARVSSLAALASCLVMLTAGAQTAEPPVLRFVDPRNGSFFASYLDIELPGGMPLQVSRAFQSISAHCGIFGCGWSSEYETYLSVEGDGSVMVHEYGGGQANIYRAPSATARDLDTMVDQITEATRAARPNVRADSMIAYSARLRENIVMRRLEWKRFVQAGKLRPPAVPVGTRLRAATPFGMEEVTRTATGYVRRTADGTEHTFDGGGRLVRATNPAGAWLAFSRDPAGRLTRVGDDRGRSLAFVHDAKGRLTRVTAQSGKYAVYRYDARGDLVWTRDADGIVITHRYDGLHNLTRIGNADSSHIDIAYHPISLRLGVRSVTIEDGTTAHYDYRWTPGDSLEYFVDVTILAPAEKGRTARDTLSRRHHAFIERRRATGDRWMARIVEEVDGVRVSTDYDEECGLPIRVVRGSDSTVRTLDARCRAVSLQTTVSLDSITYDDATGQVTRFVRHPQSDSTRIDTRFDYDSTGRLTRVVPLSGGAIRVERDTADRTERIVAEDGTVALEYDARGRVALCRHSAYGAVRVSYAADGSPSFVAVPGETVDETAFQTVRRRLARLLRPTGLTLGCEESP